MIAKNPRALISKEPELLNKIKVLKKKVFEKENALFGALENFVSIQAQIKDFYLKVYLPRLGKYMEKIEELKEKMLGRAPKTKESLPEFSLTKEIDENPEVKKEIKIIYRKLAKLYHPDRIKDMEEKDFLNRRMSDINEAFDKGDIDGLRRYLKRADAEMGLGLSSLERIKYLQADLTVLGEMKALYDKKIEIVKENQMCKLMNKTDAEKEDVYKETEERLKFDIALHKKILKSLEKENIAYEE
ncbi:MAG: J domain-containing protein [Elusimicrobia bacterium]|nr:J domain-containing protein [Elusimicrobiota bacterium]